MKRIGHCFNPQLSFLREQAARLEILETRILTLLPDPLNKICRLGSFSEGKLLLYVSQASFSTELYYYLPTLRDALRREPMCSGLISIKLSVRPMVEFSESMVKKTQKPPLLSPSAGELIAGASKIIDWQPLKEALLRLSSRVNSDG